ncbi:MAG: TrmH family RNA methyltransferase [Bacteroidetes bacterium]|jgi:tRNA G18 (ribose-2'-O)-methylase SpoU|nr:TrmH family RNA methyltransferase [Bacteroidota bacterium]MBT3749701.1 TrmH family RNA methyltransferase [Bacteroidota bacterium]MBT4402198.1 TrmH family RNA methyltransferase [Bacteroidota bacterium]MBT5427798.1 TrmH family RNA methyltransferase [Bacteroidota bacterium]MBT7094913.1 TrmH family RNA methyltransferase [Bacteroidota bacterium]
MKQLQHKEIPKAESSLPITILCDGISLPVNIGNIFRLADAFGVERIVFAGQKIDVRNRKVKQVSRSTHLWIPYSNITLLPPEISELKNRGYFIIALEITDNSQVIQEVDLSSNQKTALIIGSEHKGISEEVLSLCDKTFHIPIFGQNTSMNVANALAVSLYEISKQISL